MKKIMPILLCMLIMITFSAGCSAQTQTEKQNAVITLQVANPMMTVNGVQQEIDPGRGTAPIVADDRTLLLVRAVVEAMGGDVFWDEETQTTVLAKGNKVILLTMGSKTVFLNEIKHTLDTVPIVQNERTMLPIRFIAEGFGYTVIWDSDTQIITLTPGEEKQEETDMTKQPANTNPLPGGTGKSIVVYFSQTGTTRPLALKIAELTGSDVYEIIPEVPYTAEDINYGNNNSRANREQNDDTARPSIAGDMIDLSGYDTIYLGYPIWWGTMPRIIQTFMDTYDLFGRTIMPFATSHSSEIESSVSAIKRCCPGSEVRVGFRTSGQINETDIRQWLSQADK